MVSKVPSSSRSHSFVAIDPSGSEEVDVNVTGSPVSGDEGETENAGDGARLPGLTVC